MANFLIPLGVAAQDKITGFKGIVTTRCEHIYGCNTYGLTPAVGKEGKKGEIEWFDEGRLKITGHGILPKSVQVKQPGSETRDHP